MATADQTARELRRKRNEAKKKMGAEGKKKRIDTGLRVWNVLDEPAFDRYRPKGAKGPGYKFDKKTSTTTFGKGPKDMSQLKKDAQRRYNMKAQAEGPKQSVPSGRAWYYTKGEEVDQVFEIGKQPKGWKRVTGKNKTSKLGQGHRKSY